MARRSTVGRRLATPLLVKASGDVLLAAAEAHADREILVFCGHTHGGGTVEVRPNLRVITGAAEYGAPRLQEILDLS